MRKELELIALIERYLRNELSADERQQFEQRLQADEQLQQEVALQQDIMAGVQRIGLRASIKKAYKNYRWKVNRWKWMLGAAIATALLLAGAYWLYQQYLNDEHGRLYNGELQSTQAGEHLTAQMFTIDAATDTVLIGKEGLLVVIPENAFADKQGNTVSGSIQIELREALTAADIVKGGLSTRAGDQLLETGGMFYINAMQQGDTLHIANDKELLVEVPAAEKKAGMHLFDGVLGADGQIDWQNPRPIENYLIPRDIFSLNFYPPSYLDSLAVWGLDAANKTFTDSLFYSFYCATEEDYDDDTAAAEFYILPTEVWPGMGTGSSMDLLAQQGGSDGDFSEFDTTANSFCRGIQPSEIQAIWNRRFQNTNIATKEFEKRLQALYGSCSERLIEVYIETLDKPLYYADSIVAKQANDVSQTFWGFYAQKAGRVKLDSETAKQLSAFYTLQSQVYKEAAMKTYQAYWNEQWKLDSVANEKITSHEILEIDRKRQNLRQEFTMNLKEAYRQLGYDYDTTTLISSINTFNSPSYVTTINSFGWKNVDRFVAEQTELRETIDYTDKQGNTAVIKYYDIEVEVLDDDRYDRVHCYLLSPGMYSFMRLKGGNGAYKDKLNELLVYAVVVVGYRGDDAYLFTEEALDNSTSIVARLKKVSADKLEKKLADLSEERHTEDVMKDLDYQQFFVEDQKRRTKDLQDHQFRNKLSEVVFPCGKVGIGEE